MGIGYYWANMDRKEYIDTLKLGDNDKWPIGPVAAVLFQLVRDRWGGERITLYSDSGDLPWSDYVEGHEVWKDVSGYGHVLDGWEWHWNPNGYDDPVVLEMRDKEGIQ